jgi:hypothetical protein
MGRDLASDIKGRGFHIRAHQSERRSEPKMELLGQSLLPACYLKL